MAETKKMINDIKFSSIEYFDNGICIHAKIGKDKSGNIITENVYLRNEDIQKLITEILHIAPAKSSKSNIYKEAEPIPLSSNDEGYYYDEDDEYIPGEDDDIGEIEDAIY